MRLPGYSPYTVGSPEPPTALHVLERQRQALVEIRRILTEPDGLFDFLTVIGRISDAVERGLGGHDDRETTQRD